MFKLEKEEIYYGLYNGKDCINPPVCYNYFGENVYDSCRVSSVKGYQVDYNTFIVANTVLTKKELLSIFKACEYSKHYEVEELIDVINKCDYHFEEKWLYLTRWNGVNYAMLELVENLKGYTPFSAKEIEYLGKYIKYRDKIEELKELFRKKYNLEWYDLEVRQFDKLLNRYEENLREFYHQD